MRRLASRSDRLGKRRPTTQTAPACAVTAIEPAGVQAPPGHDAKPVPDSVEQADSGIATVRDGDDAAVRQPARDLEQSLSGPVGQRLMAAPVVLRGPLRRREHGQEHSDRTSVSCGRLLGSFLRPHRPNVRVVEADPPAVSKRLDPLPRIRPVCATAYASGS